MLEEDKTLNNKTEMLAYENYEKLITAFRKMNEKLDKRMQPIFLEQVRFEMNVISESFRWLFSVVRVSSSSVVYSESFQYNVNIHNVTFKKSDEYGRTIFTTAHDIGTVVLKLMSEELNEDTATELAMYLLCNFYNETIAELVRGYECNPITVHINENILQRLDRLIELFKAGQPCVQYCYKERFEIDPGDCGVLSYILRDVLESFTVNGIKTLDDGYIFCNMAFFTGNKNSKREYKIEMPRFIFDLIFDHGRVNLIKIHGFAPKAKEFTYTDIFVNITLKSWLRTSGITITNEVRLGISRRIIKTLISSINTYGDPISETTANDIITTFENIVQCRTIVYIVKRYDDGRFRLLVVPYDNDESYFDKWKEADRDTESSDIHTSIGKEYILSLELMHIVFGDVLHGGILR